MIIGKAVGAGSALESRGTFLIVGALVQQRDKREKKKLQDLRDVSNILSVLVANLFSTDRLAGGFIQYCCSGDESKSRKRGPKWAFNHTRQARLCNRHMRYETNGIA